MNKTTNEIHITVLSQAPFKDFGDIIGRGIPEVNESKDTIDNIEDYMGLGAYKGDGKDLQFTPDRNASARIKFTTEINLETKQVIDVYCESPDGTTNLTSGEYGEANPLKHSTLNPSNNTLGFDYTGANPIPPVAPSIDVKGNLQFTNEANGNLHIQGKLHGDGFPATSTFIHFTEANENGVMLGSSAITAGTDKDTGVIELFGEAGVEIMHINLSIGFDDNHIPISVTNLETNQTYSVEEWNDIHKEKPMITPEALTHIETCIQNVDNHVTTPSTEECLNDVGEIISQIELVGIVFDKNGVVASDENTTSNESIKENQGTKEETNTQDYNISPTIDTYLTNMKEQMANVDDNSSGRTLYDDFGDMD